MSGNKRHKAAVDTIKKRKLFVIAAEWVLLNFALILYVLTQMGEGILNVIYRGT